MKGIRILVTVLASLALILCGWSIYSLGSKEESKIEAGLNFIYFASLLIAFFSFRISLSKDRHVHPVVLILALLIVGLSTYVWFDAPKLLSLGRINLGLIALLIGVTLMILVKSDSKLSKVTQLCVGITALLLTCATFLQIEQSVIYTIGMVGLALSTILLIIALALQKSK